MREHRETHTLSRVKANWILFNREFIVIKKTITANLIKKFMKKKKHWIKIRKANDNLFELKSKTKWIRWTWIWIELNLKTRTTWTTIGNSNTKRISEKKHSFGIIKDLLWISTVYSNHNLRQQKNYYYYENDLLLKCYYQILNWINKKKMNYQSVLSQL